MRHTMHVLLAAAFVATFVTSLAGQTAEPVDSFEVVPGARYRPQNAFHEALLGRGYRDLWTTPIKVPVLNLGTFAGGLTPVRTGGHKQTLSLRLEAKDGREYNFRSVDKELTPAMPDFAKETVADWVRQDQTSAQFPTAPVVTAALLDAVGILNPGPRLVVMPDDPRLGEFRAEFAGVLGTIEVHPDEGPDDKSIFHGAVRVAGTDRLEEHLLEDLDDRVDARAFLRARLMDLLMGDWDRHGRQWRWARYDRDELHWWVPVPEDRDYAFVDYDGLLLDLARRSGVVRLTRFRSGYPDLLAMVDNSLDLTQRLLAELPYEAWDTAAAELKSTLTDEVIRDAVRQMPPEHFAIAGTGLIETLQARRDALPRVAREFFLLLNQALQVHGTNHEDRLEAVRRDDGTMELALFTGPSSTTPRFHRILRPEETREVRVYLRDGDDRAVIRGAGGDIVLRVIGGDGDDVLEDASRGPTAFYDSSGDDRFVRGPNTSVDRRPWRDPPSITSPEEDTDDGGEDEDGDAADPADEASDDAPNDDGGDDDDEEEEEEEEEVAEADRLIPGLTRDWGSRRSWFGLLLDWRPHAELVVGGGPTWTRYGFRHQPYASRVTIQALYAPLYNRSEIRAAADFRRENSSTRLVILGVGSRLDATDFRGFGNDSPPVPPSSARVWRDRLSLSARLEKDLSASLGVTLGGLVEHHEPVADPGTPAAIVNPFGVAPMGRIGAEAGLYLDWSDDPVFPRRGARVEIVGSAFPALWDVEEPFGHADAVASAYLSIPAWHAPVLAVRTGGSLALGQYPFYDAAFIGGSESLRGYSYERFAGDRSLFGSAELRVPLTQANLLLRGDLGLSIFADAGRVYFDGRSTGSWHRAVGGGVWFALPIGVATFSYARGENDRLYLHLGLPF